MPPTARRLDESPLTCPATIRDAIDTLAERRDAAPFLVSPDTGQTRTFAQARRQCRRIAQRLADLGLRRGERVAMLLPSGRHAAELILGAIYGGFVPVPLNPEAGASQLTHALGDCATRLLLVADDQHGLVDQLLPVGRYGVEIARLDHTWHSDAADDVAGLTAPAAGEANDPALLIYTSGSTGSPKGALFTQAQLLACARNTVASHALTAEDRLFCALPLHHMNAVDKLLGVLLSGGAMVIPPRFTIATFWAHVAAHRCTGLVLVPTIIAQVLAWSDPSPDDRARAQRHVRFVRSSSAPLSATDHRAFEDRFGLPVVQGLGMTEAGGVFLNPLPPQLRKLGAVGLPHGFEVRILAAQGQEVGSAETGDILVRGPSIMQGYDNDAAATAAVLDAEGWLRTGDRGYRDSDGYFFVVGRTKELIIKGGTNIAPHEIDAALAAHPAILEAAAVGVPDHYLGEEIVAYAVLNPGAHVTPHALRDFCAARIGEFKTPAQIVFVDALPKGPSGKVQRLHLRSAAAAMAVPGSAAPTGSEDTLANVPPRTPVEILLADLWKEALALEVVSVHANFFALGGYSLLAVKILGQLRRRAAIEAPLRIFFETPTIATQALAIAQQLATSQASAYSHDLAAMRLEERQAVERTLLARNARAEAAPYRASVSATFLLAPVQPTGLRPPVFCIYGGTRYRELAKRLGPEQPTYAVLPGPEIDLFTGNWEAGRQHASPRVDELAAMYLEQIRSVQPRGPYSLIGHSFGGRVALEIAQQLHRSGDSVALLVALDTFMPGATRWLPLRWFAHHVNQSLRRGMAGTLENARHKVTLTAHIDTRFRRAARRAHVPPTYHGQVVLLRATAGRWPGYRFDPHLGWAPYAAGGLAIHDIPADHDGMLKNPAVQVVADTLRSYLAIR